jgi:hypothetical protein
MQESRLYWAAGALAAAIGASLASFPAGALPTPNREPGAVASAEAQRDAEGRRPEPAPLVLLGEGVLLFALVWRDRGRPPD